VLGRDADGSVIDLPSSSGAQVEPGLVVYRFGVGVFYANAGRLTEEVLSLVDVPQPPRWLVLLAEAIDDVDFTGGETLVELAKELSGRGVVFAVADAQASVIDELDRFGLTAVIGEDHVYASVDDAIAAFRTAGQAAG
jgi:MFS superfamily sulfate permease-like transporter